MLNNLKALVVVLALSLVMFHLCRPICLRFMSAEAFERRRNVWLALSAIAFVSPEFWIFAICEFAILFWLVRKEENPVALFAMFMFVIPNIRFYLPTVLVNQLFDLTQYRILALAVLIPAIMRLRRQPEAAPLRKFGLLDTLMLGFVLLQIVLPMPYESFTNTMRRGFLLVLDLYLVVYAFQRLASGKQVSEVLACFWLATAVMAPVAVFETVKGWQLYTSMGDLWGDPNPFIYLFRGGNLRAVVSASGSINLGCQLAVGLGAFLYLWRPEVSRRRGWAIIAIFAAALFATSSRGAWVTAMLSTAVFLAFRPNAARRLVGTAVVGIVALTLIYFSPLRESVIDRLPIIGTTDQDTIQYRQQLFEVSWQLIKQNPLFGDPFAAQNMESLRQGQGIIDIVNGYIFIALFNGLVTLAFFVGSFALTLVRASRAVLKVRRENEKLGALGVALFSVLMGSLFYIGTAGVNTTHYILLGLFYSYWRVSAPVARSAFVTRPAYAARSPA